jgi:ATP-dependent Clp protease ATP-binding subunit ClpC
MFERYTERARRVLFFARYEASEFGSLSIETEHVLLGLVREGKGLTSRLFERFSISLADIRAEIIGRTIAHPKIPTSVEIPFTGETRRILQYGAEEADRLMHGHIGTEHLLLGILREERCLAATLLMQKGMRLDRLRSEIVDLLNERDTPQLASESTVCCFCGEPLRPPDSAAMVLYPSPGSAGSQTLHLHRSCLRSRVPPGVPLITDDDDDDGSWASGVGFEEE